MSNLIEHAFEGSVVRTIEMGHEVYFVARDVAATLGYSNPSSAISRHCKGVVKCDILTNGGVQSVSIITERDVYRLIMRSNLPSAERFEEWVVGTVLPSIRKNGGYISGQEVDTDPSVIMAKALQVANSVIQDYEQRLASAIRTKAEIGQRREATAMNTASQAVKRANKLEVELDKSKQWSTIKRMEMITGLKFKWKLLSDASKDLGHERKYVYDANYGKVRTYHVDAWQEAYALDINH